MYISTPELKDYNYEFYNLSLEDRLKPHRIGYTLISNQLTNLVRDKSYRVVARLAKLKNKKIMTTLKDFTPSTVEILSPFCMVVSMIDKDGKETKIDYPLYDLKTY